MNILDSGSLYFLAIFVNVRCEFCVLQSALPNCMSINSVCLKINEWIQEYFVTKNERKDQRLWFVSEFQKIQLCVGHTGRQVGCFVVHPLLGHKPSFPPCFP